MSSDAILDSKLSIQQSLDSALELNAQFQANPSNRAHLARQLLIYERIVIGTKDFGIVGIAMQWLGKRHFRSALESNTLCFLHKPALLGYGGNGHGLLAFTIDTKDTSGSKPLLWWQEALFADPAKAIDLQLRYSVPSIGRLEREELIADILSHTQSVNYEEPIFTDHVANESYKDIVNSTILSAQIKDLSNISTPIDLRWLDGLGDNQIKVSSSEPEQASASTEVVLKIAEVNLLILMAAQAGNCDLHLPKDAYILLREKLARCGAEAQLLEQFVNLLDLAQVPDVGVAVETGDLSFDDIWRLRQGRASKRFREWLRATEAVDSRELERLYVESLGQPGIKDSLPLKVVRFALTTTAGVLHPVMGMAVSAIDSFFVDQLLKGYTPKVFLDQLRSLYPIDSSTN